jgi:hypothetical protein
MALIRTPAVFMYVAAALSLLSAAFELAHGRHSAAARSAVLALSIVIIGANDGKPRPPWSVVVWVLLAATLGLAVYDWSSR